MSISILFVHGGGEGAFDADAKLVESLRTALGDEYKVIYPQMPNEDSPDYDEWKDTIISQIDQMQGNLLHEWGGHDLMHLVQAEQALMQPFIDGDGCGPWEVYFTQHKATQG
jgi:hypothetical protein